MVMKSPAKPKRKSTTEIGRSVMQRERQRMAREQAALGEAMMRESQLRHGFAEPDAEYNAIARGIVRRITAVLASEDVCVPMFVRKGKPGKAVNAWTDFAKISVTYRPQDDKRVLAAVLRGTIYHEAGHCRFTSPPKQLFSAAVAAFGDENMPFGYNLNKVFRAWNGLEDQRMETAVVSDSPRKAAYLTPLIMSEHTRTIGSMAANYPLLIWRKYLPRKLRAEARKMFVTQHNLIGKDGEALAQRCEAIVTAYVLATDVVHMWEAVCDMHRLMEEMLPIEVADFGHEQHKAGSRHEQQRPLDDYLVIPISQDMVDEPPLGPEPVDEPVDETPEADEPDYSDPEVAEHIINTLIAMFWHPETLVPVIYAGTSGETEKNEDAASPSPDEDEQAPGQGEPSKGSEGDEPSDEQASEDGAGGGSHSDDGADNTEEDFSQDDLDKMLQDVEEERDAQKELDADMRAFDDARRQDSQLDVYTGGLSNDAAAVGQAMALAEEIERSFKTHTMDREPAWVEGQRRGMLNVLRYATRRPGETEVFRQWTDDEQPGYDIAVSLLLDYSSSMSRHMADLATTAYATKLACDRLGIPCTVSLWDTDAKVLWDANERPEGLPVLREDGGTDPGRALADLDNQRCERAKHIVLIMTDGEWQNWSKRTLAAYKEPGRSIFGFGYGGDYLAKTMLGFGADAAFAINDLMEIPHWLEQFLIEAA